MEALADDFLHGCVDLADAGAALYVAAALQVYFTRLAASLPGPSLRLLTQRGLCPCCGSTPVSGVITEAAQTRGARYLYCSLCATAWNHVRAVCITCGQSRSVALKGIEGESGAVKAETCNDCHTYAKMLYQARDMQVDPFADDLATLGLDVLVAEAGWSRHAPNPLLLVG
jgi:FdhE protein